MNIELKPIAQKKLKQMGATVHGVLVKNEAGAWAAVSEAGRVMWLDSWGEAASAQGGQGAEVVDGKGGLPWFVRVYNSGYEAGHHDTVEGGFTPIHYSDVDTYHEEQVLEILEDLGAQASSDTQPQPAVPEGWKLVPVEPTRVMADAVHSEYRVLHDDYYMGQLREERLEAAVNRAIDAAMETTK